MRCGGLQALRGAREIVLPLQGSALALTAVEVGTVVRLYALVGFLIRSERSATVALQG